MLLGLSKVQIANMALSNLGDSSSIEAFTEQTPQARQVRLWYDVSRIATLEAFDWSFARKRRALALHGDDPPDGVWSYRYQYPDDCVSARMFENPLGHEANAIPFKVEQSEDGFEKTILTDLEDAVLVYTKDVENPGLYTLHFAKALSYILAHHMAISITGKISMQDKMFERWQLFIALAPSFDANESIQREPREAEWIRGRES